jgi:hypothetical protein
MVASLKRLTGSLMPAARPVKTCQRCTATSLGQRSTWSAGPGTRRRSALRRLRLSEHEPLFCNGATLGTLGSCAVAPTKTPLERRAKGHDRALRRSESRTINYYVIVVLSNSHCMQIVLYFIKIFDGLNVLASLLPERRCCFWWVEFRKTTRLIGLGLVAARREIAGCAIAPASARE